jgi:hypothetical protein
MQQKGGDKPNDVDSKLVNRFSNARMEKYMNPIYGLVYCEIGYVPNVFYLTESKIKIDFIPENHLDIIDKMIKEGSTIRPSRDIMNEKVTLTEIGQYIAIKYVNMIAENEDAQIVRKNASGYVPGKLYLNKINSNKNKKIQEEMSEVVGSIKKFSRYIPFADNDIFVFHMLLFCLWWKVGNNDGFDRYYEGIQKVFNIVNECFPEKNFVLKEKPISSDSSSDSSNDYLSDSSSGSSPRPTNLSFEQIVVDITRSEFQLYQQEQSLHFCERANGRYYADCGETTARNIINILCYDGKKFNLEYLSEKGAIEQLKKYYEDFNTFELQSTANARNEWSKLIIEHAQNDINFSIYCETEKQYGYDMNSGFARNGEKPNLLQMLQNLLQNVDTWDKLINTNIKEVESKLNVKGIGDIYIKDSLGRTFTVHLQDGHFYVSLPQKSINKPKNYNHFKIHQKYFLDILYKKNRYFNYVLGDKEDNEDKEKEYLKYYLNLIFSSEKLVELFDTIVQPKTLFTLHLKTLLLQLTLTEKYDSDTRRRMFIYYNKDDPFFDKFCDIVNSNELIVNKVNEYQIIPSDSKNGFEFVTRLPALKVINNTTGISVSRIEEIDLSPLRQIEHIGENFLTRFTFLIKIDLSPLSNVKTIGNNFLKGCRFITQIDLSSLSNVEIIGRAFIYGSTHLEKIDLSPLKNIKSIPDYFLANCIQLNEVKFPQIFEHVEEIGMNFFSELTALKTIDLSCFSNVKKIDNSFLSGSGIERIDLSPLKHIFNIPNNFMSNCTNLTSIIFPETFENVETIGESFLKNSGIETIDLSCFSNVTKIGIFFLDGTEIETIDLSPLKNLTIINSYFMINCKNLTSIILPETFENVETIGTHFLAKSTALKTIDLSCFSNVTTIDNSFLLNSGIERIDLTPLKRLFNIHSHFMDECKNLTSITFPETFENVKIIDDYFLSKSRALKTIDLSCFSNVKEIGRYFLDEAEIETIDLSPLKNLTSTKIHYDFLKNSGIKSVVIPSNLKGLRFGNDIEIIYANDSHVLPKPDEGRGKRRTTKKRNLKRKTKRKTKRNRRSLRA